MIEPPAAIRSGPVAGAIAPPSIQALIWWHEMPHSVHEAASFLQPSEAIDLDRGMTDHGQQLLMRPNIGFERRNVQVANCDHRAPVIPLGCEPRCDLVEELKLVGEF